MTPDLELISTDALLDELAARCDHMVVACLMERTDDGEQELRRLWRGNTHTCIGLAVDVQERVLSRWRETEEPVEGDDG